MLHLPWLRRLNGVLFFKIGTKALVTYGANAVN